MRIPQPVFLKINPWALASLRGNEALLRFCKNLPTFQERARGQRRQQDPPANSSLCTSFWKNLQQELQRIVTPLLPGSWKMPELDSPSCSISHVHALTITHIISGWACLLRFDVPTLEAVQMKRHHKQKWWSKASASANENVARWVRYESAVNYRSFSVVLDLNFQKVKFPEPNPTAHHKRLFSATATEWLWVISRSRCATQGEKVLAAF